MNIINKLKSVTKMRLIKISNTTNIFGKKFSSDHHIIKTLKQIHKSPEISYKQTDLYKYHNEFRPHNQITALSLDHVVECDLPLFANPWGYSNKNKKKMLDYHSFADQHRIT